MELYIVELSEVIHCEELVDPIFITSSSDLATIPPISPLLPPSVFRSSLDHFESIFVESETFKHDSHCLD